MHFFLLWQCTFDWTRVFPHGVFFWLRAHSLSPIVLCFGLRARFPSHERFVPDSARFLFHRCLLGQCARVCSPICFFLGCTLSLHACGVSVAYPTGVRAWVSMRACVCVCVFVRANACVREYACLHGCARVRVPACVPGLPACVRANACLGVRVRAWVCVRAWLSVLCVCACVRWCARVAVRGCVGDHACVSVRAYVVCVRA